MVTCPSVRRGGMPITRGRPAGRAILDRQTIHVHDLAAEIETEFPRRGTHAASWWHSYGSCHAAASRRCCNRQYHDPPTPRFVPSRTNRSRFSRPSPIRPSSPSRTCGCSRNSGAQRGIARGAGASDGNERGAAAVISRSPDGRAAGARRHHRERVKLAGASGVTYANMMGNFSAWSPPTESHPSNSLYSKPLSALTPRVGLVVRSWSESRSMIWMPKWNITRCRLRPELERPWLFRSCVRIPRSECLRFGAMLSNRLTTDKSSW